MPVCNPGNCTHGVSAQLCTGLHCLQLYKYQEQSQLLDAYLEGIVQPLAGLLRQQALVLAKNPNALEPLTCILGVSRLLNILVIVRGFKTVVRFFPNEASDLEVVLGVLLLVKGQTGKASKAGSAGSLLSGEEERLAYWEAQTMLVLWLSILILIPFELSTVDTASEAGPPAADGLGYTQLVAKIMDLCMAYLQHPGSVRDMAALLLGRLLTRPDQGPALKDFLDWSAGALKSDNSLTTPFLVPGVLQALCNIFKLGQRSRLLGHTRAVWQQLSRLRARMAQEQRGPSNRASSSSTSSGGSAGGVGGVLARKLAAKLTQRLGLTFLEPRLAPWRYTCSDAGADLHQRLGAPTGPGLAVSSSGMQPSKQSVAEQPSEQPHGGTPRAAGGEGVGESGEYEIVAEVEEVIDELLQALTDRDTVVRWSAAKGLGRVTGCLPRELGDEVLASVLQLFAATEGDTAWHGGCLALAELARRGLLLPERLPELVPIIQSALVYDVRRGPHSIGAHVRDAAAYVCWAAARAYAPDVLTGHVTSLATQLLTVACYDREVNCRRAAAAAFQEMVGRLGNFPHGIELMTIADYFAVGNVKQAYLTVAPAVATYPDYGLHLARHLVTTQLRHWDKVLRELAAQGLAALAQCQALSQSYLATQALDTLLPLSLDQVLEVRHGAVVGIAALLPALQQAGHAVSPDRLQQLPWWCLSLLGSLPVQIAGLVPAIDKARLHRGKGGEVMRQAVSILIGACADAALPASAAQHGKMREALEENLRHPQLAIQSAAVRAIGKYTRAYIVSAAEVAGFERTFDSYLARLHDPNVAVRRGCAAVMGVLPPAVLQSREEKVVDALVDGSTAEEDVDERDVESRAHCIRSLGHVCSTLCAALTPRFSPSSPPLAPHPAQVLPHLATALEDYTTDNRGDMGSWVREAAMEAGEQMLLLLAGCPRKSSSDTGCGPAPPAAPGDGALQAALDHPSQKSLSAVAPGFIGLLLKQAVERIARVREAAVRHLRTLLSEPTISRVVPGSTEVLAQLPAEDADISGLAGLQLVHAMAGLLGSTPRYCGPLLEGLVASIGCVDAQLAKAASAALLAALSPAPSLHASSPAPLAAAPAASSPPSAEAAASEVAPAVEEAPVLLQLAAEHLVKLWVKHARSPRMAGPLIKVADLLVTHVPEALTVQLACPTTVASAVLKAAALAQPPLPSTPQPPAPSGQAGAGLVCTLPEVVVELTRAETRMCSDVAKLLDAAALLCHLLAVTNPCRTSAYQGLMVLLVSKYPKVRRFAAEQLYLALLTLEPGETGGPGTGIPEAAAESAQELVLETTWDGTMEEAKSARDSLAQLLQVPLPVMKAPAATGVIKQKVRDENESYQALLDDFARGV
ncbi:armadillo-type protein [Haematococcus lacustris]